MEEWDILHSLWLYELIELPGVPKTVDDHWKPGPRTRGLSLPILLKVGGNRSFRHSSHSVADS